MDKGDNRRIRYSLNQLSELTQKSTDAVNWYPHRYDGTVRGPNGRWFKCLEGAGQNLAYSGDDVEYAAAAMNALPDLIDQLREAVKIVKKTNDDHWFMINLIERYSSNKEETLKDCLERMKFRKPMYEEFLSKHRED